jgi:hypothetical protein
MITSFEFSTIRPPIQAKVQTINKKRNEIIIAKRLPIAIDFA